MTKAYLLDTNVVSELRKLRPHGGVMAWAKLMHRKSDTLDKALAVLDHLL